MSQIAIETPSAARPRQRRRRPPTLILVCVVFVSGVTVAVVFGPLIAPHDPNAPNLGQALLPTTGDHWLGTDGLGRDMLSRLIVGARTAFVGAFVVALAAMVIGNGLGLVAGYRGGRVDAVIMRWVDLMYALPSLLVAIVLIGVFGGGYVFAVALLIAFTAPYDARLIRGATLEQRPLPYVEAAKALGLPGRRIMVRHIWPNLLPIVVANTFLNFAFSLVALAGLSFLGLGAGPGTPDWGLMLAENRTLLFDNAIAALGPAAMIILTATSMNLIGDWLYEWLSDRGSAR